MDANMEGMSTGHQPGALVEQLDLSFGYHGNQTAGEDVDGGLLEDGGAAQLMVAGGGSASGATSEPVDDTLNTPLTVSSDLNFNFIKSQLDLSQEAPPIIGELDYRQSI